MLKRTASSLRVLTRFSDRVRPFVLITVLLPFVLLALFGLYAIVRYNYILLFLALLVILSLLASIPVWWARRKLRKQAPTVDESIMESLRAPDYWTAFDRKVQEANLPLVRSLLEEHAEWKLMPDNGLQILRSVAAHYGNGRRHAEWAFSPVELLAITQKLSQQYRQTLKTHVPGVEHLRISHILWLDEKADQFQPAVKLFNIYRKVRVLTPEGLVAELRAQLFDQTFTGLSDDLQAKTKYRLLLEVLHVAIDLYGGHFQFDEDELSVTQAGVKDQQRMAAPPEPVRVCLLGQVGAGKSSVINALTGSMRAEVSVLPATDRGQVYQCSVDGSSVLHLVDLPGLNGDPKNDSALFEQIIQCDLVLWVLKANQPARKLDQEFGQRLQAWLKEHRNRARQPPVIIGLLNQVDRLGTASDWQPPYDLQSESPKSAVIREALDYNREMLGLEEILPISVSADRAHFNVNALQALLMDRYDKALNVQLNRRRQEAAGVSLPREWARMKKGAKTMFSTLRRGQSDD